MLKVSNMKYMGSKNRIAKDILPIMLKQREKEQWWVEPFVGGANMIDKVKGNRMGADNNELLICALLNIQHDTDILPKNNIEFTEQDYKDRAKNHLQIKGFAAFAYSYSGKFWGGWCRDKTGKRDYVKEAYNNAIKQSLLLDDVVFKYSDYNMLDIPNNSIIYCDPPYNGTTRYKDKFNHKAFWEWCRKKKAEGHTIFISEYNAPDDFKCIWKKEICSSLTNNTGSKKGIEKLFTL